MLIWGLVAMKFSTTPTTPWSSARVVQVIVFWSPAIGAPAFDGEMWWKPKCPTMNGYRTRFYWKCYWFLLGILLDFYWLRRVHVGKMFNRHGMILKGLSSVSLDPNIWETPHVFRPKKYHHFCHFCTTPWSLFLEPSFRRCPRPRFPASWFRSLWHHMLQRFKELTP